MRILLTNDDGVYAPGLQALREELTALGDVTVVAPATEQSAVGHSITILTPLIVQELFDEGRVSLGWAVEGRPADCVKLALLELLPEPPDLVVSGINSGANTGINVLYSGTVAAAVEGAFFNITSIAVSLESAASGAMDFHQAAKLSIGVIDRIINEKPAKGSLFNVNIPNLENGPPRGIRMVPQNLAPHQESFDRRTDPRGRVYFWNNPDYDCPEPHPDSDVPALAERYITVTPLQFNLTHRIQLEQMRTWQWREFE